MRATSPASTFKIPNSLIALEVGAIKDENGQIKWVEKPLATSLEQKAHIDRSLQNSTVWFYHELARRVGEKNYNKYLKACRYNNF